MQRLWWIMQPKEQGVLMWQTGFELEFLPQRKPTMYQPDLGQTLFANIALGCLVGPPPEPGGRSLQLKAMEITADSWDNKSESIYLVCELWIWYFLKRKTTQTPQNKHWNTLCTARFKHRITNVCSDFLLRYKQHYNKWSSRMYSHLYGHFITSPFAWE